MYVILGVDPGKTIGVACLDLKGKLVFSSHYPNESLEHMISEVRQIGVPVLVAGDKEIPSEFVRKVNAKFNARIFSPNKVFSLDFKRRLGRAASLTNQHECDAYAAAISAYHHYANKFNQVDHLTGKSDGEREQIKRQVVTKHSIHEAETGKKANRQ